MSGTMLSDSSYKNIEKEHGERGRYLLNRFGPWALKLAYTVGLSLMIYGGIIMDKNVEKGQKYFGGGAGVAFVSGLALDKKREFLKLKKGFDRDEEEFRNFVSDLEKKSVKD